MVGPSTGSPHLHTGPLPLQVGNPREIHYGGPHHWRPPKSTHWPPSSAGLKSSYWPLSSAGRNQHGLAPLCRPKSTTGGPTLQAENKLLLAPLCRPKSTTGGPTLQAENELLLAPLCRPKSITRGPTLQAELIYYYPNLAMALQQYTPIRHQRQQYYPLLHSSDGLPSNPLSHPRNGQSQSKWPWQILPWLQSYLTTHPPSLVSPDGLPRAQAKNPGHQLNWREIVN